MQYKMKELVYCYIQINSIYFKTTDDDEDESVESSFKLSCGHLLVSFCLNYTISYILLYIYIFFLEN